MSSHFVNPVVKEVKIMNTLTIESLFTVTYIVRQFLLSHQSSIPLIGFEQCFCIFYAGNKSIGLLPEK